jgi:hypothetical protein
MTSQIVSKECLCSFVAVLEDQKTAVQGLIQALIVLLTVLKTYLQLFNVSVEDELRRLEKEGELAVIETTIDAITVPFNITLSYTRIFADCDPITTLSNILKETRNKVLAPLLEKQYEVEQFLLAIADQDAEIEWITRTIDVLGEINTALDECGTS